ncbi:MAG: peptidoglycan D,D-transpeptidase FtsI family protein [Solirubrobacterales bacterium]
MNVPIGRLYVLVVMLFAILVAFTSYWSVFAAEDLRDNEANRRPLLEQQRVARGEIRTVDGELLAVSEPQGRGGRRVFVRSYPEGPLFGHPVGYDFVDRGRTGIERSENDVLVGRTNEFSTILEELEGRADEGSNLTVTLDAAAQRVATQGLAGRPGSVVAIEPATGAVRAMVSVPGFDPNLVRVQEEFEALNQAEGSPLFNRATQSSYPPGSTMKVVTAAAALDSGEFEPDSIVNGDSPKEISGVELNNFANQSFGDITLTTALTNSVNTAWAQVAEDLGGDVLFEYMDRFGFNALPPLDYPPQQMRASGVYRNSTKLLDDPDEVDIGRVAIGQERLEVTPLQMAMVTATIANGGELAQPTFLQEVTDPDGRVTEELDPQIERRVVSEQSAAQLTAMMADVVREGTGTAAALTGVDVAGKTGTAEVNIQRDINQPWFIGFAPVENPQVAVAVTVERSAGTGGVVAAPIARDVMEELLR